MTYLFYIAAAISVTATAMVITRASAVHALLYLITSLLATATVFFELGAAFAAMLEIIIYAGAIMVLFIFVIMMLNLGSASTDQERKWLAPSTWRGPAFLCLALALEMGYALLGSGNPPSKAAVDPKQVGVALFGPYVLAVEIASFLLLAGLVGAYHLGRPEPKQPD